MHFRLHCFYVLKSFKRCFKFLHVLTAKRCSSLLIYQNAAKANFEISLVTGHEYHFSVNDLLGKVKLGPESSQDVTGGWGVGGGGCWHWGLLASDSTILTTRPHNGTRFPCLLFYWPPYLGWISWYLCLLIWEFCQCPERRVLQSRCVSLPEPAPTSNRTPLKLGRKLCPAPPTPGCDLQAPGTLSFRFFNRLKGSVTASK